MTDRPSAERDKVVRTAPGHVEHVREHVIDALTPEQINQLTTIADAILSRIDPDGTVAMTYRRDD